MIVKEDFLNKLRQFFGLNLYEVRIWTALLSRGVSTAGELSDIGEVPRSRAYDVLESLEKKGFVLMKVGKPIKYLAVEPKEVVERVKRSIKDEADQNILKLKELNQTDVISELNSLYKNGVEFIEPADLSGAIRGRHNIYSHLETMVKKSTKSINIVTTSKGVLRKIDTLSPTLNKLAKRGVSIKISAPETEENKQTLKEISKIAEIKELKNINARFCIVDGNEMMFMMMHDDEVHPSYDLGIWVNTPYFAKAMNDLLNNSWNNSS
jgi:sugar-specific transcriptional regulator TrmB